MDRNPSLWPSCGEYAREVSLSLQCSNIGRNDDLGYRKASIRGAGNNVP
jgi:hypothetical protein